MSFLIFGTEVDAKAYGDDGPYPFTGTDTGKGGRFAIPANKQTICWAQPRAHPTLSEWAVSKQPAANNVANPASMLREEGSLDSAWDTPDPDPLT